MVVVASNQSLAEIARRVGVTDEAVRKAARKRQLTDGVSIEGNSVKVHDVEAAVEQWHSMPSRAPADPDTQDVQASYWVAKARRESALADMAEIEVAERRGELISVDDARTDVSDKFTIVRTRILGVPTRIAQRLPKLAAEVVPVLDELLREALEELAADGDRD